MGRLDKYVDLVVYPTESD